MLFSLYMAMQYVRGRHFRAVVRASVTDYLKLKYGRMTDKGIRYVLAQRGLEASPENISRMRRMTDDLDEGHVLLGPTKASLLGISGQMVSDIGFYLFKRGWHIYATPPILLTCDEPVVPVPGPPPSRGERGGVADAGVVLYPLSPSLLLAMFDGRGARPRAPHDLSYADLAEINLEVVGASSTYTFERATRDTARALQVPKAGDPTSRTITQGRQGDLHVIRRQRLSRWANAASAPPWPVERWFSTS